MDRGSVPHFNVAAPGLVGSRTAAETAGPATGATGSREFSRVFSFFWKGLENPFPTCAPRRLASTQRAGNGTNGFSKTFPRKAKRGRLSGNPLLPLPGERRLAAAAFGAARRRPSRRRADRARCLSCAGDGGNRLSSGTICGERSYLRWPFSGPFFPLLPIWTGRHSGSTAEAYGNTSPCREDICRRKPRKDFDRRPGDGRGGLSRARASLRRRRRMRRVLIASLLLPCS